MEGLREIMEALSARCEAMLSKRETILLGIHLESAFVHHPRFVMACGGSAQLAR